MVIRQRWYLEDNTRFEDGGYFKGRETQLWKVYVRPIKQDMFLCDQCQHVLNKLLDGDPFGFINMNPLTILRKHVCVNRCIDQIENHIRDADTIIMGNKDYVPVVELQRSWIKGERNEDYVTLSKENYEKLTAEYGYRIPINY